MRNPWQGFFGSAKGAICRLSPQTRIACGASVFAVCFIVPVESRVGLGVVTVTLLAWALLTRPPFRMAGATLLFGLVTFLPYYLIAPLVQAEGLRSDLYGSLIVVSTVIVRGLAAMLAATFTVATLSMSALHQGIRGAPLPGIVKIILIQIVHQAATLVYETRRIAQAIEVRGGTTGYRTAISVIVSLPGVWIPRIVNRATRVGDAMALREYSRASTGLPADAAKFTMRDMVAVAVALVWLAGVIALRLREGR